jgi:hypothetical protein
LCNYQSIHNKFHSGVPTKIWTTYLTNTSQKHYCLNLLAQW